jgi:phenylpropionate dioxygenase-like ring-hydroxylating dioxygenase large terminal subunit
MKVDANWKTVMEPFMEAYHIAQTHPEITHHTGVDRWNIDAVGNAYKVTDDGSGWGDYAGRGAVDGIPPSPIPGLSAIDFSVISNKALHDGIDAALMQTWQLDIQQELYHEKGLRDFEYILAFNQRLYEEADRRGMAILPADQGGGAAYGFVFPNIVITASYGNAFIQRTRPDSLDPEKTIVEFYAVSLPQNDDQVKRPKRIGPLEYEDWGFVVQQDLSNIEKVQRGVKTKGFTDAFFSGTYEALIVNFHRTLETYIDRY